MKKPVRDKGDREVENIQTGLVADLWRVACLHTSGLFKLNVVLEHFSNTFLLWMRTLGPWEEKDLAGVTQRVRGRHHRWFGKDVLSDVNNKRRIVIAVAEELKKLLFFMITISIFSKCTDKLYKRLSVPFANFDLPWACSKRYVLLCNLVDMPQTHTDSYPFHSI